MSGYHYDPRYLKETTEKLTESNPNGNEDVSKLSLSLKGAKTNTKHKVSQEKGERSFLGKFSTIFKSKDERSRSEKESTISVVEINDSKLSGKDSEELKKIKREIELERKNNRKIVESLEEKEHELKKVQEEKRALSQLLFGNNLKVVLNLMCLF